MSDKKLKLVNAWINKADRDLDSAKRLASGPDPYFDTAIFHCQQAAEKALKGYLVQQGAKFEKINDLCVLVGQCIVFEPEFNELLTHIKTLTPYITCYRYPDKMLESEPDMDQVSEALELASIILDAVRKHLPKQP